MPILCLTAAVHIGGRLAALCHPYQVDSYVYAVAAYRLWQPDATFQDLIPDKPPGQALLTGWCYRLWPGRPTRLVALPVESAFMITAYALFYMLARRLFQARAAAALTLCFTIAHNSYNVLDVTTDGFNLNENYLALPIVLAVFAHLTVSRTAWRGFLRGFGVGLALTIKQTAVGVLLAMAVHGAADALIRGRSRQGLRGFLWSALGLVVAWTPIVIVLAARGWLAWHVQHLARFSGKHLTQLPVQTFAWYKVTPILPFAWWAALGLAVALVARSMGPAQRDPELPLGREAAERTDPLPVSPRSALVFTVLWLVLELAIIQSLSIPALHYLQQVVAPAALIAGLALTPVRRVFSQCPLRSRLAAGRAIGVTTAILITVSSLPLLAEVAKRPYTFQYQREVAQFARWLETWSPGMAANHLHN